MTEGDDNGNVEDADDDSDDEPAATKVSARRRLQWIPEQGDELANAMRQLAVRPWLLAGRDDELISAVKRNVVVIRDVFARLGWVLVVERDYVRLRKSAPPRLQAWASAGPTSLQATWFWLLVAGADGLASKCALGNLVAAARNAAAEVEVPSTNDVAERRAIVFALRMLDQRGIIEPLEGDVEGFVDDDAVPVLLQVHHRRLGQLIANYGAADPSAAPDEWLRQVQHEPDAARRMRRRLVDDALVYVEDLDAGEAEWLSKRVRGEDGEPLARAFGLRLERRIEGAAFVVPDELQHRHDLFSVRFLIPPL